MYSTQLDVFVKAAEYRSFSKAANAAYISPSALIQQINLLENRLGVTLFERSNTGVKLTKAGQLIYDAALEIMQISNSAVQTARSLESASKEIIHIGISTLANGRYMNSICDAILTSSPQFDIEFTSLKTDSENLGHYLGALNSKQVDLFESVYFPGIYQGQINFLPLFETDICIAVPPKHRLYDKEKISINNLIHEQIIAPWSKASDISVLHQAKQVLRSNGSDIKEVNFYDWDVVSSTMLKGKPALIADAWSDIFCKFKIFHLNWDIHTPYGIVYPLKPEKKIKAFISAIEEYWNHQSHDSLQK